jgi:hypothetical protein
VRVHARVVHHVHVHAREHLQKRRKRKRPQKRKRTMNLLLTLEKKHPQHVLNLWKALQNVITQ